jgi:hypothetical protein
MKTATQLVRVGYMDSYSSGWRRVWRQLLTSSGYGMGTPIYLVRLGYEDF